MAANPENSPRHDLFDQNMYSGLRFPQMEENFRNSVLSVGFGSVPLSVLRPLRWKRSASIGFRSVFGSVPSGSVPFSVPLLWRHNFRSVFGSVPFSVPFRFRSLCRTSISASLGSAAALGLAIVTPEGALIAAVGCSFAVFRLLRPSGVCRYRLV
jgi:hypothetical protein